MNKLKVFTTLMLFGLLISCGTDCDTCEPIFTDHQLSFVNLGEPHERMFRLDSVLVGGSPGDTIVKSYLLKEIISELNIITPTNREYAVERWISNDNGESYAQIATDRYAIQNNEVIRQYGNLPYKVLDLPYQDSKNWNGSEYFNSEIGEIFVSGEPIDLFKGEWQRSFEFLGFELQEEIENVTFDSVITVSQADMNTLIDIRYSVEKYAWNKGLVFREMKIFDEFCDQATDPCREDLPWELRANRGFYLKQWRIN